MSMRSWLQSPKVRRGIAASAIVLSAGGLVLVRAPASAGSALVTLAASTGTNATEFDGPGLSGTLALSHTHVLSGGERRMFAELELDAKAAAEARERAPISMVVVLDTSGSMSGEKIEEAKQSVIRLIRDMRDDDRVAFVRYASDAELVQSMARVGDVRQSLIGRVGSITASGGTYIPGALRLGLEAMPRFERERVQRIVLVSDGLDSTRDEAVGLARDSAERGITISALGVGLDFDESYMTGVASAGHGNFAFVEQSSALARFLERELHEAAHTTIASARVRLDLPEGVRFVRAYGADAESSGDRVDLRVGSMFAGDHRRVIVELAARLDDGDSEEIAAEVSYERVGGDEHSLELTALAVTGTSSEDRVADGRDGAVMASATSVVASDRQMEAAEAYRKGDGARAQRLIQENLSDLRRAAADAPAAEADAVAAQAKEYEATGRAFQVAAPRSAEGSAAAKKAVERDAENLSRVGF